MTQYKYHLSFCCERDQLSPLVRLYASGSEPTISGPAKPEAERLNAYSVAKAQLGG